MVPLPTVAGLPSYGLITPSDGLSGATAQAMKLSASMKRPAPMRPSSES